MKNAVSLWQAFWRCNPGYLCLTSLPPGLTRRAKREILSLVKKLNRERGITVIMVSHDMNEVFENVDRVIVFPRRQSGA